MKILVVEDDTIIRDAINYSLKNEGYQVICANDGVEALQVLQHDSVELIIADIMLPNLSGLGLLSMLKRFYFTKVPVILISALNQNDVISSAAGLGATDYITKPFSLDDLKNKVKKVIN